MCTYRLISQIASRTRFFTNYHFWIIAFIFAIIIIFHYPQQLHIFQSIENSTIVPGLTRHAIERVLLLIPIAYSSFVFGIKGGIASLIIALSVMMPRAIFFSTSKFDAIFESLGIIIVGSLIIYWFDIYNSNVRQRKVIEEILEKIVDGYTIPTFVINKDHKVTHWNTAMEALSGIKRGEIIGTSDHWRAFYKEKRWVLADFLINQADEEDIKNAYSGSCYKSPLLEGAYEAEAFFPDLGKKGKWFHFTASLIKDSKGEIIGAVETLFDVTARINAEENLKYYVKEITRTQEEERKRIARELHDDTAQNLIALMHQLENLLNDKTKLPIKEAQALWGLYERIRDILQGVRQFSRDLRPSILDDLGLLPALEWMTEDIKNNYYVETSLKIIGEERRLSPEAELLLFRIVQEALRNVAKHAKASNAEVKVEFLNKKIRISITDDGIGFELPDNLATLPYSGKLGLTGLEERVRLLNGILQIKTEPNKGTSICVEAPIQ